MADRGNISNRKTTKLSSSSPSNVIIELDAASSSSAAANHDDIASSAAATSSSSSNDRMIDQEVVSLSSSIPSNGYSSTSAIPPALLSNHVAVSASPSPAASRSRPRRRLPQSGLVFFGRRWLLGAEDMCFPACWSSWFDLLLLSLSLAAWRLVYTSSYDNDGGCTAAVMGTIETYVVLHGIAYALLLGTDFATMVSAVRSNMFVRNKTIVAIIYMRIAITVAVIIITLSANISYFGTLRPSCPPSADFPGSIAFHHLLAALFLASLCSFLAFILYFLCSFGFGPCCGRGTSKSWSKHLTTWLCCYTPQPSADGRNVLEGISWLLTEFFARDAEMMRQQQEQIDGGMASGIDQSSSRNGKTIEDVHIVPSDILVGFALIEAIQVRRAAAGYKFLTAAPINRWSIDAFKRTGSSSNNLIADERSGSRRDDEVMTSLPTSSSRNVIDIDIFSPSSSNPFSASSSSSNLDRAASDSDGSSSPDSILAQAASHGAQPTLDPRDWQRIADAQHFACYALGSYGWPLYTFNNLSCLFTCKACRCCTSHGFVESDMIGSGCGCCTSCGATKRCCHWSLSSFLLTTGVDDRDVLYASLDTSPIYYLTIDHHQQCIVICCRGSLSVSDAVIDMDAQLTPLDQYGYPHSYTHLGILENALRLKADLDDRGHMSRFLDAHPMYNITIVGHSLGAGTATLLTLLLRERYDAGPPSVITAGRLTPSTRNRLTCVAYGCPLIVSLNVAHSEFALRCITTIVNHSDIISRMSLSTCSLLKDQMIASYAVSSSSKFRILSNSLRKRYSHSFEVGADMGEVSESPDNDSGGVSDELILGSMARAMDKLDVLPSDDESSPPPFNPNDPHVRFAKRSVPIISNATTSDKHSPLLNDDNEEYVMTSSMRTAIPLSPLNAAASSSSSSVSIDMPASASYESVPISFASSSPSPPPSASPLTSTRSAFTLHLRQCFLPGRIYHILPGPILPSRSCFRGGGRGNVVYPAGQATFQEIVVNKSMFTDHMPEYYLLDKIEIPNAFKEATDVEDGRKRENEDMNDDDNQV